MSRCSDCIHDGCCEYSCGGLRFKSRFVECLHCSAINDYTDMESVADGYVCYCCLDEYMEERIQE